MARLHDGAIKQSLGTFSHSNDGVFDTITYKIACTDKYIYTKGDSSHLLPNPYLAVIVLDSVHQLEDEHVSSDQAVGDPNLVELLAGVSVASLEEEIT